MVILLSTFKYLKVFYRKIDPPDLKVAGKPLLEFSFIY